MLNRCALSVVAELHVDLSIWRQAILVLLLSAALIVIGMVAVGRYPLTALPIALLWAISLAMTWRDPAQGLTIRWSGRDWWLREPGAGRDWVPVMLAAQPVCLSWVLKLVFCSSNGGARWTLLIFNDAASTEDLKALRRRIMIEPGHP